MESVETLLKSGDLDGARAALVDMVRGAPQDQGARMFLFQLFVVLGEWDKAASQLKALAQISPEAQMLAVVCGQAIAAEKTRADAFAGRVPFHILVASSPWVEKLGLGLGALARGEQEEGERLRSEAFDEAIETPGEWDGRKFLWIADADGRFGPCLEAIVAGRWGLIPFEAINAIKSEGPKNLRDVVWLPVQIVLRSGQSAAALICARYPGTESSGNSALQLSRQTVWRDEPFGQKGLGQRVLFFDDGTEADLLSLRNLAMA